MQRSFEENLAFGRKIEMAIGSWLMGRGLRILPVYDYSGLAENKAPKLTALNPRTSLVLPDLLGSKGGRSIWFEVKYKEHADWTRKTSRYETGISLRLWNQYKQVEAETGLPVWLLFVHRQENEVRGDELKNLRGSERIYDGQKMGWAGMVFFDYSKLRRLATLSDVMPVPDTAIAQ